MCYKYHMHSNKISQNHGLKILCIYHHILFGIFEPAHAYEIDGTVYSTE